MRMLVAAAGIALAFAAQADEGARDSGKSHRPQVSSRQCGLATPFNVLADSGGIWLYRDNGSPREIFFHRGELSVDHKVREVGDADAQRLWQMEQETRALMPQAADVAHDVANLSYDALGGVVELLTGSWLNARKVERLRQHANDYIDGTLGQGRWDQDAFDGNFGKYVETQADEFKGSIMRHVLWQVMTGRSDAIDARADEFGDAFDARLDAQGRAIEAKADALCANVQRLRQLQDALEFRYEGQPLAMLSPLPDATAIADNGDVPRSTAIEVEPRD